MTCFDHHSAGAPFVGVPYARSFCSVVFVVARSLLYGVGGLALHETAPFVVPQLWSFSSSFVDDFCDFVSLSSVLNHPLLPYLAVAAGMMG